MLAEAAGHVGHVPIRMRGTIGGSLAHADPAAELPVALLALDASLLVRSLAGARDVPIGELLRGPFTTSLEPGEAIVAVTVPAHSRASVLAFAEFAVRAGDFALASVVVLLTLDGARSLDVRIVLGGVEATAIRAIAAESLLDGAELTDVRSSRQRTRQRGMRSGERPRRARPTGASS